MSVVVKQILANCKKNMKNTYDDWDLALDAFHKIWTPANNQEIQESIIELEDYMNVKGTAKTG